MAKASTALTVRANREMGACERMNIAPRYHKLGQNIQAPFVMPGPVGEGLRGLMCVDEGSELVVIVLRDTLQWAWERARPC